MPKKRQATASGEQGGWGGGQDMAASTMGGRQQTRRKRRGRRARGTAEDRTGASARRRGEAGPREITLSEIGRRRRGFAGKTAHFARGVAGGARDLLGGAARGTQSTVSGVAGYVREHPWPSLLIGAGATWIAVDAIRGRGNGAEEARPAASRGQQGRRSRQAGLARRAVSAVADAGVGAGRQVGRFVRDNPLAAGAATLGLGVAVGMAFPSTVAENEMLGEARDKLVRKAKDVARTTAQAVKDTAEGVQRLSGAGAR